jgi:hypothetical protein
MQTRTNFHCLRTPGLFVGHLGNENYENIWKNRRIS